MKHQTRAHTHTLQTMTTATESATNAAQASGCGDWKLLPIGPNSATYTGCPGQPELQGAAIGNFLQLNQEKYQNTHTHDDDREICHDYCLPERPNLSDPTTSNFL
uniref:(northern house mosquito) hypothetical protein n=1 Tax=Culex pipiens TaxID=7175 RepID=A0A8D8LFB7_CULPI